jgi:diguanylate cyclase (GGDEF)-like protein/PAS domain S-box-containing protein
MRDDLMFDEDTMTYDTVLRLMESAPANIFFKDTQCKYRFVTEICSAVNGGEENSIIGKTDLEIQMFPELGRLYYDDDIKILATGKGSEMISEFPLETGSVYYEIKKQPVFQNGKVVGIIGIVNDVTKRVQLEKEFEELAFRDKLTGLHNRNYLETRGRGDVQTTDFPITLIAMDCNRLKQVNDTLGHEYGDLLLQRIAHAIVDTVPETCVPIRTGGDEFLLFCMKHTAEMAEALIARIKQCFRERSDYVLTLSAAFGYYTAEDDSLPFSQALHLADQAMYEDKRKVHNE